MFTRPAPAPLFAAIAATAALLAIAPAPAGGDAPPKAYSYKKIPQGELQIFVHLPPEWKSSDHRPAIVFFFGGGWRQGSPDQFLTQAEYLARRGMVAARADYRVFSRQKTAPDSAVEDAKSAVRWLRGRAGELGIDPERIVAAGGSAGGHIAACTALAGAPEAKDEDRSVSSRPNALVLFNPVLDVTAIDVESVAGTDLPPDVKRAISPTLHLTRETPPAILFYGTADRLAAQGEEFRSRSRKIGNRVELFTADGMPHGFFNRAPWQELTLREADRFLASLGYLKGEPTLQPAAGGPSLKRVE